MSDHWDYGFWGNVEYINRHEQRQRVKRLLSDIRNQEREPVTDDDILNLRIDLSKINCVEDFIIYLRRVL